MRQSGAAQALSAMRPKYATVLLIIEVLDQEQEMRDLVLAHDRAADGEAGGLHGRQHARERPLHLR